MAEQVAWHRLFGLSWVDFFLGTSVEVKLEHDLSLKKQLLDVVLIRKGDVPLDRVLPDGFEDLASYNLITFKSHQEKLSLWALQELVGYYTNLRKQESPSTSEDDLLASEQFRLFAVVARFPQQLANSLGSALVQLKEGVYQVEGYGLATRIVVANLLPQREQNAMLHLFSVQQELFLYGVRHYHQHSGEMSTVLVQLYQRYSEEGTIMSDALKQFADEFIARLAHEKFAEEIIARLVKDLPLEKRLEGLTPEQRLEGLPPEKRLEGLSPEKRLEGLTPEQREELLRLLLGNASKE